MQVRDPAAAATCCGPFTKLTENFLISLYFMNRPASSSRMRLTVLTLTRASALPKIHRLRAIRRVTSEERSRREWSRWESSDIDEARRASKRERANQSKRRLTHVPKESHRRKD